MIIERAIEKMRRETAANAAARPAPAGSREAVGRPRAPVEQPTAPRPVFPQLECESKALVAHRILAPGTALAANERVAAAYRMIRTRLTNKIRSERFRSIAITSPGAGEGKTVTSINLAFSLARDPLNNVFLLDLDMRNPSVCKYLGVHPAHDLISYFSGDVTEAEVFFSVGLANLAIAGSGTRSAIASELIGSDKLEALIQYIIGIAPNSIVLIDLPPVLVTDEALLVAPRVDATLIVVAEGKTRRDSLARARSLLGEFPCAGVILNRSTEIIGVSGYYYDRG